MKKMETRTLETRVSTKSNGTISGYAAVFDSLSEDLGGFREKIAPGAFADTIKDDDIRAVFNHDANQILGRSTAGTLRLKEDSRGLFVEITPPSWAKDIRESIRRGDVSQMSFKFQALDDEWEDNSSVRTLKRVKLFDIGPCVFAAYPQTTAHARTLTTNEKGNKMNINELYFEKGKVTNEIQDDRTTEETRANLQVALRDIEAQIKAADGEDRSQPRLAIAQMQDLEDQDSPEFRARAESEIRIFEPRKPGETRISLAALGIVADQGKQLRADFDQFCVRGLSTLSEDAKQRLVAYSDRALQADLDTAGGFLMTPQALAGNIIAAKDNLLHIRGHSTLFVVTGGTTFDAPELDADPADSDFTAEIKTGTEDSTMKFGKRSFVPQPLAKLLKVSNKLVRLVPSAGAYVTTRLAYKCGVAEERAFMTGTGSNEPLGVFTAAPNAGITTGRDTTLSKSNTITGDDLLSTRGALASQYKQNAKWLFHRDVVEVLTKLKDGEGNYLWRPGLERGQPNSLLGYELLESEYAPSTFSASNYIGMLGDFSQYWIVESLSFSVQVLVELYAATAQTGYISRSEIDGAAVDENAFARMKLGT